MSFVRGRTGFVWGFVWGERNEILRSYRSLIRYSTRRRSEEKQSAKQAEKGAKEAEKGAKEAEKGAKEAPAVRARPWLGAGPAWWVGGGQGRGWRAWVSAAARLLVFWVGGRPSERTTPLQAAQDASAEKEGGKEAESARRFPLQARQAYRGTAPFGCADRRAQRLGADARGNCSRWHRPTRRQQPAGRALYRRCELPRPAGASWLAPQRAALRQCLRRAEIRGLVRALERPWECAADGGSLGEP